jgi:sugar lactone lactonase YvrE
VDPRGFVYVADENNHYIKNFTLSGTFISKLGGLGSAEGEFNSVTGIAIDSQGNIYTADYSNSRIQKFSSSGVFLLNWSTGGMLLMVAVDSNDDVYVTTRVSYKLIKYNNTGGWIKEIDVDSIDDTIGIAIDSNDYIYITDDAANEVQKYDSDLNNITKWGGFSMPCGIEVDEFDNIYVGDAGSNNTIQVFDTTGVFITQWGGPGAGDGQFNIPIDLAAHEGYIYITDYANHRVQKFQVIDFSPGGNTPPLIPGFQIAFVLIALSVLLAYVFIRRKDKSFYNLHTIQ